jgi:hypothetical protein
MGSLIPTSQGIPSGNLRRATQSGYDEFHRMRKGPTGTKSFATGLLATSCNSHSWLTRGRESKKPWSPQSHLRFLVGCSVDFFCRLQPFVASRIGRSSRLGNRSSCTVERSVSCLSSRLEVVVSPRDTSRLPFPIEGAIPRKTSPFGSQDMFFLDWRLTTEAYCLAVLDHRPQKARWPAKKAEPCGSAFLNRLLASADRQALPISFCCFFRSAMTSS